MTLPNTLNDIITKVRRVTGRPSQNQLSDQEIIKYVNTFYVYDMPEHLKMESLRANYQFTTTANIPAYDLPTDTYLTSMPTVSIGGYQAAMSQCRDNYFRINPGLTYLQNNVSIGTGSVGGYSGILTQTPIVPGFKPNPPGAYSSSTVKDIEAKFLNWNVMFTAEGIPNAISGISPSISLVDDGQGNLFDVNDTSTLPANSRGTINYITGAFSISGFSSAIPTGSAISAQYVPYVASRPQSVMFYQDQFILYPVPDQAYTVSFEAYKYPISFQNSDTSFSPQLKEWWQMLAYGAADKIFADNGDFENMQKFRPLLDEQMRLCLRRTIVQQTSERVRTIYTDAEYGNGSGGYGSNYNGF